jgi:hypothetical protein
MFKITEVNNSFATDTTEKQPEKYKYRKSSGCLSGCFSVYSVAQF